MIKRELTVAFCAAAFASLAVVSETAALTSKECSAKYQAAKSAGTLGGKTWNEFRKTECAADAPATAPESATKPAASKDAAMEATPKKLPPTTAAPSSAVFPTAVAPKYAKESAGKARMHTCLDRYNANKANNANGGLKWIVKGGGYYSECNKRLKS
jgi:hypothetical protein